MSWEGAARHKWLHHGPLVAIVLLALSVRLLYFMQLPAIPTFDLPALQHDTELNDTVARNLLSGQWLGGPEARFATSPLYSYFLALLYVLFGRHWLIPPLIQLFLGAFVPLLLYGIGWRAFGRPVGLLAAFMAAIYGPLIFVEGLILVSALTVLVTCIALLAVFKAQEHRRYWDWLLAGAAIGLLGLLGPNGLVLLPVVLVWTATAAGVRKALLSGSMTLLGTALVLAPMVARNYYADRDPALAVLSGVHFYLGNNPWAQGGYTALPIRGFVGGPRGHVVSAGRIAESATGRTLTPAQVSWYWYQKGFEFIREQPGRYLRLLGRKLLITFNDYEMPQSEYSYYVSRRYAAVLRLPLLTMGLVSSIGLLGMTLSASHWKKAGLLHLFFLAYLATLLFFFVNGRYRLPLIPVLMLFAAFAVHWGFVQARARAFGRLGLALAAAVPLYLVTHVEIYGRAGDREGDMAVAEQRVRRALAYRERERQIAALNRQIAAGVDDFQLRSMLGNLYRQQGRADEAARELARAVALDPAGGSLDAQIELALALETGSRYPEAKERWEAVLAMDPPAGLATLARRHLIRLKRALRPPTSAGTEQLR